MLAELERRAAESRPRYGACDKLRARPLRPQPNGNPKEATSTDAPAIQVLASLDELKGKLEEIDAAWAVSDDAMREVFQASPWRP